VERWQDRTSSFDDRTTQSSRKVVVVLVISGTDVLSERNQTSRDDELAARSAETTLLITGASGADIERRARSIHAASARAASPFVQVAAATLPVDARGFTDTCASLLKEASGGSLLLHDVEDMHAINQNRLIETLVELQQNVGKRGLTVRLIAGTTASLGQCVATGTFSDRLFYRLNVIHVLVGS
jgi:DNA-binding NtrC family response regulator